MPKTLIGYAPLLLIALMLWALMGLFHHRRYRTPDVWAASCSAFDIQIAVYAAKKGQVVGIPMGTCVWLPEQTVDLWPGTKIQGIAPYGPKG
jgi:hypothetical protein